MMDQSSEICGLLYELARNRNACNVELDLNGVRVLIVQRLEDADHVLRLNSSNYRKNMGWLRQVIGASRFSEDGREWEIRRDLTQVYFNKFDRERTFRLAASYAQIAFDRMIERSRQGAVTLDDNVFRELTASVLVENFLDIKLSETAIDLALLAELMEYGSEYSFVPAGKTTALYRDRLAGLPELRRRALASLRVFRDSGTAMSPMLEGMLAADHDSSTSVLLEHELTAFLAAGAETSAATMSWVCYMLAAHPELQRELAVMSAEFWRAEEPSWERLSLLKPLSHFVSETLRLYPPTPIVARIALAADAIGDRHVEPGQNVLVSFVGIQHDARLRKNPWAFDIGEEPTKPGSGINTSFSFGPRVCGGKQFALVELITFLSVFLAGGSFELTSDEPPTFHWKSQMLRQGGQPVHVRKR